MDALVLLNMLQQLNDVLSMMVNVLLTSEYVGMVLWKLFNVPMCMVGGHASS